MGDTRQSDAGRRWTLADRALGLGFALLLAAHCLAVLGFVIRRGRLSIVPLYDDVSYFSDGLDRLDTFDAHGLPGLISSLLHQPPHSLYSSILATFGFAITPGNMLGGYILNCLWILAFFSIAWRLLRDLPRSARFGLMTSALSIPMFNMVIGAFRPDLSWGLIGGGVAVLLATRSIARSTHAVMLATGMLVGFASLTKPTGLAPVLVVMGVGYLGALAIELSTRRLLIGTAVSKSVVLVLGMVIVAGPYLAVAWRDLLAYITDVLKNDADIWRTDGDLGAQLAYYVRPALATEWLGWWLYALPVIVLAGLAGAWRSGGRTGLARGLVVLLVFVASYAIPTASPVKTGYFGCLFYGTAVAAALWGLGRVVHAARIPGVIVAATGALVFAVLWRDHSAFMAFDTRTYHAVDKASRAIVPPVIDALATVEDSDPTPVVYLSSPGPVYDGTLKYFADLRKLRGRFIGAYVTRDWERAREDIRRSSIVIAAEDGAIGQEHSYPFPMLKYQREIIDTLSSDEKWHQIASFTDEAGFKTVAFSQIPSPPAVHASFRAGFRDEEGPVAGLPKFHWMIGSSAVVVLESRDGAGHDHVQLRCEAVVPVKITVSADPGGGTVERSLPAAPIGPDGLQAISVPMTGQHQTLTISVEPQGSLPEGWPGPMLCASAPTSAGS